MSSMSRVRVIRIDKIDAHPNADSLGIIIVDGLSVICRLDSYKEGDLAIYVPVDLVAPQIPETEFLGENRRVVAKKLRGVMSFGILLPNTWGFVEGEDIPDNLGFTKWEPPILNLGKGGSIEFVSPPKCNVKYTDIENLRRYQNILNENEQVILHEKIHGANARFVYENGKLFAGTHYNWVSPCNDNIWNRVAIKYSLDRLLKPFPNYILCGEVYGNVKNFTYGVPKGQVDLVIFDVFDVAAFRYMDYKALETFVQLLNTNATEEQLRLAPVIYKGNWLGFAQMERFAEGNSMLCNRNREDLIEKGSDRNILSANHIREGFVVRPLSERYNVDIGRTILKLHGKEFLSKTGKQKKEKRSEFNEENVIVSSADCHDIGGES